MSNISLETYQKKRDFAVTPEPSGEKNYNKSSKLRFVIQKHLASHLHYDFRLEMAGVLKSWSVPKGPSLNPLVKRLAIATEDHPLAYQNFEGIIPKGQYGGGSVIIWDNGYFSSELSNSSLIKAYEHGHLTIKLNGQKLKGKFLLQRLKALPSSKWLLCKLPDKYANKNQDILEKDQSVISGRTIAEIAKEGA